MWNIKQILLIWMNTLVEPKRGRHRSTPVSGLTSAFHGSVVSPTSLHYITQHTLPSPRCVCVSRGGYAHNLILCTLPYYHALHLPYLPPSIGPTTLFGGQRTSLPILSPSLLLLISCLNLIYVNKLWAATGLWASQHCNLNCCLGWVFYLNM